MHKSDIIVIMQTTDPPVYLTLREAADFLRMPDWRLRNNYRKWGIPAVKAGRALRFRRDELVTWLESSRVA